MKLAQLGLTEEQLFGSGEWSFVARDDSSFLSLETDGAELAQHYYPLGKDPETIGRININLSNKPSGPSLSVKLFETAEIRGLSTRRLLRSGYHTEGRPTGWATLPSLGSGLGEVSLLLQQSNSTRRSPLAVSETAIQPHTTGV